MKERPILFSAPMVLALLAGTKTQTRRIFKLPRAFEALGGRLDESWPDNTSPFGACLKVPCKDDTAHRLFCPQGQPGDRLWVRETTIISPKRWSDDWALVAKENRREDNEGDMRAVQYLATAPEREAANSYNLKATPSIFMPRWASRITLEIAAIRVERLQEISQEDAVAEGVFPPRETGATLTDQIVDPVRAYRSLWESINGPGSWKKNPWVWVVEFRRLP